MTLSPLLRPLLGLVVLPVLPAQAEPLPHPDGTTHWYRVERVPAGIDWPTAHRAAADAGGYLATITSPQENAFVFKLVNHQDLWSGSDGPWIGGVQSPGASEPSGGWGWVENESFVQPAWASGRPNDTGNADRVHFWTAGSTRAATWADAPGSKKLFAYVIEFSGPNVVQTSGLRVNEPGSHGGLTLVAPLSNQEAFLVDARGRLVHKWTLPYGGVANYLEPYGNLLRAERRNSARFGAGGSTGGVSLTDWSGNRLWEFVYSTADACLHHDIERLPNGNILMIAWHAISEQDAIAAGRAASSIWEGELWPDKIIEVQPTATGGRIVWEWDAWDHLVQDQDPNKPNYGKIADHPERINLNFSLSGEADWLHINAVDYNSELDQIVLSVPHFNEIWIIDHSTTTQEAAGSTGGRWGRGGDLLYRWGNPQAYGRGSASDRFLEYQHNAHWIPAGRPGAGNLIVFDNGQWRSYSRVVELTPPTDSSGNYVLTGNVFGPAAPTWSYENRSEFLSTYISGAERLPSGNTFICEGATGRAFEVTPAGQKIWEYVNPITRGNSALQGDVLTGNPTFRAPWYSRNASQFAGRQLTPGEPLETYNNGLLADGAMAPRRVSPGATVDLTLQAPPSLRSNRTYRIATSATAGMLGLDWRFARIGVDPLLYASLANASPGVFENYAGLLDSNGRASARLILPNIAGLVGMDFYTMWVEIDGSAPSSLAYISNTVRVEVR